MECDHKRNSLKIMRKIYKHKEGNMDNDIRLKKKLHRYIEEQN